MLELNASKNVAEITMHGVTHELYYRTPEPEDLVGFQAECLVRKGKKILNRVVAARLKYGERVLIGFKPGTIGFDGKAISSDPTDKKAFRKDWKDLLVKAAPQLVVAVGMTAFEAVSMGKGEEGFEFVSGDEEAPGDAEKPGAKDKKGDGPGGAEGGDEAPLPGS